MKKNLPILLLVFLFFNTSVIAEQYYFKGCRLTNAVTANYIINIKKNVIEVELKAVDGTSQSFADEIKVIEKNKIISQKIKSTRGENQYYQYFLNSKTKSVTKLQYKKEGGVDIDVFKLKEKRKSFCSDIKADWNKAKIEKEKDKKEEKEILKAQEKLKEEQNKLIKCQENNYKKWTNCKGIYKSEEGHKYNGLFKNGEIIRGSALYSGGSKYIGEFKNFKPHGYGTFVWANSDKYFGEWKDVKTDGTGTKQWQDGREYLGQFKNDKLHGQGTLYFPDGKMYSGGFINGKRHGEGTFSYPDGSAYIGKFIAGKEDGLGECVSKDGLSLPCKSKSDTQSKDFSGKETQNISIVAKKWIRVSQYEANSKKGKKVMDKLKADFETKAKEICPSKEGYNTLDKKIEVLEIDETPAYGLETKLKVGIKGVIECID